VSAFHDGVDWRITMKKADRNVFCRRARSLADITLRREDEDYRRLAAELVHAAWGVMLDHGGSEDSGLRCAISDLRDELLGEPLFPVDE
jgi:formate dehydrogenase maturation protein FdhE